MRIVLSFLHMKMTVEWKPSILLRMLLCTSEASMLALNEHAIDIIWIRHRER